MQSVVGALTVTGLATTDIYYNDFLRETSLSQLDIGVMIAWFNGAVASLFLVPPLSAVLAFIGRR